MDYAKFLMGSREKMKATGDTSAFDKDLDALLKKIIGSIGSKSTT